MFTFCIKTLNSSFSVTSGDMVSLTGSSACVSMEAREGLLVGAGSCEARSSSVCQFECPGDGADWEAPRECVAVERDPLHPHPGKYRLVKALCAEENFYVCQAGEYSIRAPLMFSQFSN